ncbi:hypothetical protein BGZ96_002139 [Linnemannia gamsii]|uniref:F-box domain-containing protein n=1 Tax=Linnemannia gamsii TaxID=64522 RepID=A0ABQ7JLA1_9FUNG|nr:hypothetical protein BGZ96_002139 [Linnemannia gamsii]
MSKSNPATSDGRGSGRCKLCIRRRRRGDRQFNSVEQEGRNYESQPNVLVNRDMNTLFNPQLWSTLVVYYDNQTSLIWTSGAFKRNVLLLRTLSVRSAIDFQVLKFLFLITPYSTSFNLTSFDVSRGQTGHDMDEGVLVLLKSSPQLQHLRLQGFLGHRIQSQLNTIIQFLPKLRSLHLFQMTGYFPRPVILRDFLEALPSKLEVLALALGCNEREVDNDVRILKAMSAAAVESRPHPKLKFFHFKVSSYGDRDKKSVLPFVLIPFLEGSPNLEVVDDTTTGNRPEASWLFQHTAIVNVVSEIFGVRLFQQFDVDGREGLQDDLILARSILEPGNAITVVETATADETRTQGCRGAWRWLKFSHIPVFGPATRRAIVEAASRPGFQQLTSVSSGTISSMDMQSILHNGRSLRYVQLDSLPTLLVADMKRSNWSCKWLRTLHVQIGGIPRPDIQTDYRGEPIPAGTRSHSESVEESRMVQRRVYARLATLECLEELCLGGHSPVSELVVTTIKDRESDKVESVYYDPGLQQTCLEWTLASGLGELAPLRYLRVLGLKNMEHRVDLVDLKWMRRHWPGMLMVEVEEQLLLESNDTPLEPGRQRFF